MIIMIDGYNMLKADYEEATPQTRDQFVVDLSRYARKRNHTIKVIFDGGLVAHSQREMLNGVEVIFVGYKCSADDFIKEFIVSHSTQNYIVVTSDKELADFVRRHSVFTISVQTFSPYFFDALQENNKESGQVLQGKTHKLSVTTHEELDALMQKVDTKALCKQEQEMPQRTKKRTKSKKNHALEQVLKKL